MSSFNVSPFSHKNVFSSKWLDSWRYLIKKVQEVKYKKCTSIFFSGTARRIVTCHSAFAGIGSGPVISHMKVSEASSLLARQMRNELLSPARRVVRSRALWLLLNGFRYYDYWNAVGDECCVPGARDWLKNGTKYESLMLWSEQTTSTIRYE